MFRRGGMGVTGKGAAFAFFFGQTSDPWDWKIVQI